VCICGDRFAGKVFSLTCGTSCRLICSACFSEFATSSADWVIVRPQQSTRVQRRLSLHPWICWNDVCRRNFRLELNVLSSPRVCCQRHHAGLQTRRGGSCSFPTDIADFHVATEFRRTWTGANFPRNT